jgi:hypothetical protein
VLANTHTPYLLGNQRNTTAGKICSVFLFDVVEMIVAVETILHLKVETINLILRSKLVHSTLKSESAKEDVISLIVVSM